MNKMQRLNLEERKRIKQLLAKKYSLRSIATELSRSKNSVVMEVRRNGGKEIYDYKKADLEAEKRNTRKIYHRQDLELSHEQIIQIISLWKKGVSISTIGEKFDRSFSYIQTVILKHHVIKEQKSLTEVISRLDMLEKRLKKLEE